MRIRSARVICKKTVCWFSPLRMYVLSIIMFILGVTNLTIEWIDAGGKKGVKREKKVVVGSGVYLSRYFFLPTFLHTCKLEHMQLSEDVSIWESKHKRKLCANTKFWCVWKLAFHAFAKWTISFRQWRSKMM